MAHILICNKDITESHIISSQLEKRGHSTLHAPTYHDFLGHVGDVIHNRQAPFDVAILSDNFIGEQDIDTTRYATIWTLDSFLPYVRLGYSYRQSPTKFVDFCFQLSDVLWHPDWLEDQMRQEWLPTERMLRNFGTTFERPPIEHPYTPSHIAMKEVR